MACARESSRQSLKLAFFLRLSSLSSLSPIVIVITIIIYIIITIIVVVLPCRCDAVVVRGPNAHKVSIPRLPIISYATGIRLDFESVSFGPESVESVEFPLTGYNEASF